MPAIVFSNFFSNLFWLASLGLQWVGWILQLGGLSYLASKTSRVVGAAASLSINWWCLFLELFIMLGIMISLVATSASSLQSSFFNYRFVFLSFIVLCLTYTIPLASSMIQLADSAPFADVAGIQTYAAGLVISSMVFIAWIFALGAEPNTIVSQFIYNRCSMTGVNLMPTGVSSRAVPPPSGQQQQKDPEKVPVSNNTSIPKDEDSISRAAVEPVAGNEAAKAMPVDSSLKAKALYNYTASPDDPTEVSFNKGEIFIVLDNKGKWWQVQKENGKVGIAPSNYLELLR